MRPDPQPFTSTESPQNAPRTAPSTRYPTSLELDRVLDVISTLSARIELEGGSRRAA